MLYSIWAPKGAFTDLCVVLLKRVVSYYNKCGSLVFGCYLDASKAFDCVNHYVLCHKLLNCNIPLYIIRLLCNWYESQVFTVKWGSKKSDAFHVTCGVRQGGVLSPYLFNLYLNDLLLFLNDSCKGCIIGAKLVNNIYYMYADDFVILCPSVKERTHVLAVCSCYAFSHDIIFKTEKHNVCCSKVKILTYT